MYNLCSKINIERAWHIRFFITPRCNFRCKYCNPVQNYSKIPELTTKDCKKYLRAAINSGINSIHWTGGEPLIRTDLLELVSYSKKIGFKNQVITTNGFLLSKYIRNLFNNGLSRVNLSIDTLDPVLFKDITGKNGLKIVLDGLMNTLKYSKLPTKLNVVVMKDTLQSSLKIIEFALGLVEKKNYDLIVKLICINPNNPAMLTSEGIDYYENNIISDELLISELKKIYSLTPLDFFSVIGDNPNCNHYVLNDKIKISLLSMPSWNHPCAEARCKKLRITPFGELTNCLNSKLTNCRYLDENEISIEMENLIKEKIKLDNSNCKRNHYSPNIGAVRFGRISEPIDFSFFQKINKMNGMGGI